MLAFQSGSSVNICFLETGHIACEARGSLKESSLGQGHCSILPLCGALRATGSQIL